MKFDARSAPAILALKQLRILMLLMCWSAVLWWEIILEIRMLVLLWMLNCFLVCSGCYLCLYSFIFYVLYASRRLMTAQTRDDTHIPPSAGKGKNLPRSSGNPTGALLVLMLLEVPLSLTSCTQ